MIGATGGQRNTDGTTEAEVSSYHHNRRTYREDHHERSDRNRSHKGPELQRQYVSGWASDPADRKTRNSQQECKVEWAYKPAANQKDKTTKMIGLMGRDPGNQKRTVTGSVSRDRETEGNLPGEMARHQEPDGGGPHNSQRLHRETETHWI